MARCKAAVHVSSLVSTRFLRGRRPPARTPSVICRARIAAALCTVFGVHMAAADTAVAAYVPLVHPVLGVCVLTLCVASRYGRIVGFSSAFVIILLIRLITPVYPVSAFAPLVAATVKSGCQ